MGNLTGQDRRFLHRFLTERFNLSELKTLAYYEGYPFEDYPHDTISDLAREMLQYFERDGRLSDLLKAVLQERPDDELARIYAGLPLSEKSARVKLELIIRNAGKESAQEIRDRIARAMGWQQEEVGIIMAVSGSLRLLLSVPEDKAPAVLALAHDPEAWLPYEVQSVTLLQQMPEADRGHWRRLVIEQAPPKLAPVGPASPGLPLSVKVLLGLLLLVRVATAAVLVWYNRQPSLVVANQCATALVIPAPTAVKAALSLPDAIPAGESVRLPVVTGAGTYELLLRGDETIVLRLPRSLPGLDLTEVPLGQLDDDEAVTLNGRLITPPQSFQIESGRTYDLIICARR